MVFDKHAHELALRIREGLPLLGQPSWPEGREMKIGKDSGKTRGRILNLIGPFMESLSTVESYIKYNGNRVKSHPQREGHCYSSDKRCDVRHPIRTSLRREL